MEIAKQTRTKLTCSKYRLSGLCFGVYGSRARLKTKAMLSTDTPLLNSSLYPRMLTTDYQHQHRS